MGRRLRPQFILLAAFGLSGPVHGARLLPIGTVYDPFICRGLDALNYACYQDARFILMATPSGLALAPEGGAHQSIITVAGGGSYIVRLLAPLHRSAGLVTMLDGHSSALAWLGAVRHHRVIPLGVERFGQSGHIPDLYRTDGLDATAIVGAVARLCVEGIRE